MNTNDSDKRSNFLNNCAKTIADQYDFDEDDIEKILSKCLPKDFAISDELFTNVDNSPSSFDVSTAINSIKDIFKPNFVQALMWMEPTDAKNLFEKEKLTDLIFCEDFFKKVYPTTLIFNVGQIKVEASRFREFIKKYRHQFLKNGFFSEIFDGSFWLPSFLTGSLEEIIGRSTNSLDYFLERQKRKIDPIDSHKKWHDISNKIYDDSFQSSLRVDRESRKQIVKFLAEDWFIEEEALLREKIISVFDKTSQSIANTEMGVSHVEQFLRLIEKTFTVPELELFFGLSIHYFSFPTKLDGKIKFHYKNNFILSTIRLLYFYDQQLSHKSLLVKNSTLFDPIYPKKIGRFATQRNLYESIRVANGFANVKKVIFKKIESDVRRINEQSEKVFFKLKSLALREQRSEHSNKNGTRYVLVEPTYIDLDDRPQGYSFSENYDTFYPADQKLKPLNFTTLQRRVIEFMFKKGATSQVYGVTKQEILNELYGGRYEGLIFERGYKEKDSVKKNLIKEFRKFRIDSFIFSKSHAWKKEFIKCERRDSDNKGIYWLDFKMTKKRKKRKKSF
jgi:hypothetical protein